LFWEQEIGDSNPFAPTNVYTIIIDLVVLAVIFFPLTICVRGGKKGKIKK